MPDIKYDSLRSECWKNSFDTFGFNYIFNQRAQSFKRKINVLTTCGILIPAVIGIIILGYDLPANTILIIKWVASFLAGFHSIISIIAIVYAWNDELSYSYEASQNYIYLYNKFIKLAKFPPENIVELEKQFDSLIIESKSREQQDNKHDIKEKELRKGMRYSLREHQNKCIGCGTIPLSMLSTNCDVCGKF